jgi:3-hydroxyisobutyrate dehydrogenase-like beta-hydroxyacid dehydrogenase
VKILNNMVVVGTVTALSEAAAIARSNGIDAGFLFDSFSKGSADSFALRNHGLKSVAPREFPRRAFSTEYMLKDLSYALAMAQDADITANRSRTPVVPHPKISTAARTPIGSNPVRSTRMLVLKQSLEFDGC